ncbi:MULTISPECIES: hypothetical protein [Streptomyces]|uniref:hypothetical protein n=1 Tax=Streptomyces TaxID=1883 RepID=UPI0036B37998
MKIGTLVSGVAGTAAVAVSALVMAPPASAAAPTTATVQVDCGDWGTGRATVTAEQREGAPAVTFSTPVVWAHHSIPADSISTTATLSAAHGRTATLTGKANPAWTLLGQPFDSGVLTGTVTPGEAYRFTSITSTFGSLTIHCTAVSAQTPGPFVF